MLASIVIRHWASPGDVRSTFCRSSAITSFGSSIPDTVTVSEETSRGFSIPAAMRHTPVTTHKAAAIPHSASAENARLNESAVSGSLALVLADQKLLHRAQCG